MASQIKSYGIIKRDRRLYLYRFFLFLIFIYHNFLSVKHAEVVQDELLEFLGYWRQGNVLLVDQVERPVEAVILQNEREKFPGPGRTLHAHFRQDGNAHTVGYGRLDGADAVHRSNISDGYRLLGTFLLKDLPRGRALFPPYEGLISKISQ